MVDVSLPRHDKLVELEALRGAAAFYVFVHHAHLLPNQGIGRFLYFGQEAVIVFFLLSGFVICYSSIRRQTDWKIYILHRAKRIYPIYICSLLLAYCSQSLINGKWMGLEIPQLMGNLFMLQDVSSLKRGVWFDTYYGNSPLWSLSYEWWFYILFIPLGLSRKLIFCEQSRFAALGISIFGFIGYQLMPNALCIFLGYFFIWWTGVEFAKDYINNGYLSFKRQNLVLFGLTLMSLLWGAPVIWQFIQNNQLQLGVDPVLQFRHHLAALLFALAGIWISKIGWRSGAVSWPFVRLAPISYAIYVTHEPLLAVVQHVAGPVPNWLAFSMALPIVLFSAWLLEVRMQAAVNRFFRL